MKTFIIAALLALFVCWFFSWAYPWAILIAVVIYAIFGILAWVLIGATLFAFVKKNKKLFADRKMY